MFGKLKKKLIKAYFRYWLKDMTAYSKKIGVTVGKGGQILADPDSCFGTEPWLIKLGDHVDVTSGVRFLNHEGGIWCARGIDKKYSDLDCFAPTVVGDNVMIGVNSLIMPGVTIGNNVIIAGHAVVTKDIPDNTIVAGVPAKPITTMDRFIENLEKRELVPTKHMTQAQKKVYLKKLHPEWF